MFTMPGCAAPKCSKRSERRTAPVPSGARPRRCSSISTKSSGMNHRVSMPMRWTVTRTKVLTVASNPGHCLWSGIVPKARAGPVVQRLMAQDMWSGWGIRTLSANNPAYNPHSYQNGSVWPHDNAIIANGFRRYGYTHEAERIIHDVCRAGIFFMKDRMPELYAGIRRSPTTFPVQYLGANVPQAWAAGSMFSFLQVILGAQPDAPRDRLCLDPALPDWLPELSVMDIRDREEKLRFALLARGKGYPVGGASRGYGEGCGARLCSQPVP